MDVDYIIVQAGGKGSRMENLTKNKPKALVPVNNLPMIFHLFRKFPSKKYIIIGDYKYDVLEKYLKEFADVDYTIVSGKGFKGTCAGIQQAIKTIPDNSPFMLIWCDLVLPESYKLPDECGNYIGISKDFECRWKYENNYFVEERSQEFGVAGFFLFTNKTYLNDVPLEGEFVRWLHEKNFVFKEQCLHKTHEYGLYSEWSKLPVRKCRPFNSVKIEGNRFYKIGIDEQGKKLAAREVAWYKKLNDYHFQNIPKIYEYEPLCMELINGRNIYEYTDIPFENKKDILNQIVLCLNKIHMLCSIPSDKDSYYDAYIGKTLKRLEKIKNLVPFANNEIITINGQKCRNVFFHTNELKNAVMHYFPDKFQLIHGDCTFSNIMLKNDNIPVLLDPRGYFGTTEFYGDPSYDWVKLYYSLISNYDQFNLKRFNLNIMENEVELTIQSNKWEELEDYYFELLKSNVTRKQMKLLLAITWLSLTTYAWEDYDSICGAFYNGILYLEEAFLYEDCF